MDRQIDKTDKQMNIRMDRQIDRQIDIQKDRQTQQSDEACTDDSNDRQCKKKGPTCPLSPPPQSHKI